MPKLYFELKLVDEYGEVHGIVRREIDDEAAYKGDRIADDFTFNASIGAVPFKSAVEVLRVREFRKHLLIESARQLGHQLTDFLEDREGWHGLDRQEGVERSLRRRP